MGNLFGTDGIRGIANTELTPELAMRVARACAKVICADGKKKKVLIGADTRLSSPMLVQAMACGFCSEGVDCVDLGVLTTPGVAYLTKKHHADAGVVISASHNPYKYNGIKIFGCEGYKLPDSDEQRIEELIGQNEQENLPCGDKIGKYKRSEELVEDYIKHLKGKCERLDGLKIAIDCANGASSYIAERVFSPLGAKCYMLNNTPNGININADCGSTHIEHLADYVVKNQLDAGLAFDGDADRLLCVNERGEVVDGDMIMASVAYDMKKRGALVKNTVVGTVMTNYGFGAFCRENGISFEATQVGDKYVLERMLEGGFSLGGEQSGHLIFSDFATTGDGILSGIMLLSLMKRKKLPLSILHSVMKRYPQYLVNIEADEEQKERFKSSEQIRELLASVQAELGDSGRIVVRPSGTEKLIRVMVECDKDCEQITKETAEKIKKILE